MRNTSIAIGDKVNVILNEPWEILEALEGRKLPGIVTDVDQGNHEKVVIRLMEPLIYDGKEATFFFVQTRYVGASFMTELSTGMAVCSFSSLSESEGENGLSVPITSWESRICAIGSLAWSRPDRSPQEPPLGSDEAKETFKNMSRPMSRH